MRRARESDLGHVMRIQRASFRVMPLRKAWLHARFEQGSVFVRARDAQILSFAEWSWTVCDRGPHFSFVALGVIATDVAARREGHAHALLTRCIRAARGKHSYIEVALRRSNETGIAFFEAHGFREARRARDIHLDGETRMYFRLNTAGT